MPLKQYMFAITMLLGFVSLPSRAIWFEASGQALIEGGNQKAARHAATEEAIKQAMLFAGASVRSVQSMTNGLLQDDRFEIRSSGDVRSIELIDEIYSNGVVTVSIRADIFPQESLCEAADYRKSIVTAWFPLREKQQAAVGSLHKIGTKLPDLIKTEMLTYGQHAQIKNIEPYYVYPNDNDMPAQMTLLARKRNSQYVLLGSIDEISVEQPKSAGLMFWQDNYPLRHFSLGLTLYDGHTGSQLFNQQFSASSPWEFDWHESVDVNSKELWRSSFGKGIKRNIQDAVQQLDEVISCLPAYGRVLNVQNQQLRINIGESSGVKQGDILTLLQLQQFNDPKGQLHFQYQIHPVKVKVTQIFNDSAVAESADGTMLANIQPNDFVARQ